MQRGLPKHRLYFPPHKFSARLSPIYIYQKFEFEIYSHPTKQDEAPTCVRLSSLMLFWSSMVTPDPRRSLLEELLHLKQRPPLRTSQHAMAGPGGLKRGLRAQVYPLKRVQRAVWFPYCSLTDQGATLWAGKLEDYLSAGCAAGTGLLQNIAQRIIPAQQTNFSPSTSRKSKGLTSTGYSTVGF